MGAQDRKHPNKDIKNWKPRNNLFRLNMFKADKVEKEIREINLLIDTEINLFVHNFKPLFLALSNDCHEKSLGTKNVSFTLAQNFWKVNKSRRLKRCGRYHIVCILQRTISLVCKITFKQIVEGLFQFF